MSDTIRIAHPADNPAALFPEQVADAAALASRVAQIQNAATTPNVSGPLPVVSPVYPADAPDRR
ncbi:hypothetical protein [Mesorhizobium sp. 8]|uniref:hypothetical protein n=1 Tax=Mesorhizobium sp. 8 TaxID=2584466 RepID=UPI0011230172|nr:hypothetical protein [Mesorhizobium sp. 8]QDB99735.1 hypothetical protein FGU64_04550 [Mesorhizobium sp. 8]